MSELAEVVASSPDLEMKATQRAATSQDTSTSSPTTPYSATVEVVSYTVTGADQLPQGPLKLLLSFGEHAREFISSETGLHLLRLLADPAVLEAQASRQFSASELLEIQRLLRCCVQFQVRVALKRCFRVCYILPCGTLTASGCMWPGGLVHLKVLPRGFVRFSADYVRVYADLADSKPRRPRAGRAAGANVRAQERQWRRPQPQLGR